MWSAQVRKSFVHSESRWHKMMIISPSYALLGIHRGDPLYLTSWTLNRWEIHINSIESTKEIMTSSDHLAIYFFLFGEDHDVCNAAVPCSSRNLSSGALSWLSMVLSTFWNVNRQLCMWCAPLQVWILHIGKALEDLGSLKFMAHERICLQLAHAHEFKHHTFGLLRSIGSSSDTGSKTELKGYWDLMELWLSLPFLQLRFIFARCSSFFNDT